MKSYPIARKTRFLTTILAGTAAAATLLGFSPLKAHGQFGADMQPWYGLTDVLPLPGKLVGYTNVGQKEKLACLVLSEGPDQTKQIMAKSAAQPTKGASDIVVTFRKKESGMLNSGKEPLPMRATAGLHGERYWTMDFEQALRSGRVIRLEGELVVPIADPEGRNVTKEIHYQFGEGAMIAWDTTQGKPSWSGFTVRVEPRVDKKQ